MRSYGQLVSWGIGVGGFQGEKLETKKIFQKSNVLRVDALFIIECKSVLS